MRKPLLIALVAALCLSFVTPSVLAAPAAPYWDVSGVAEQVKPSVVGIVVEFTAPDNDEPPVRGSGTGIIYRKDGYIITNAHVVNGAK